MPLSISLKATANGGAKYGLLPGTSVDTPTANKDAQIDSVFESNNTTSQANTGSNLKNATPTCSYTLVEFHNALANSTYNEGKKEVENPVLEKCVGKVTKITDAPLVLVVGGYIATSYTSETLSPVDNRMVSRTTRINCYHQNGFRYAEDHAFNFNGSAKMSLNMILREIPYPSSGTTYFSNLTLAGVKRELEDCYSSLQDDVIALKNTKWESPQLKQKLGLNN